jgi:8-oxo-dGTP pyrophosphatase MutT (NUDIX family)
MLKPWRVLSSTIAFADRWLTVRSDRCLTAEGHEVSPYHVLEYPDWINVVAFTRGDQRLILVDEYRHGRAEVITGLVSGSVETLDGVGDSAAEAAARRELAEETGFVAGDWHKLLDCYPNPAMQTNRVVSFIAFDADPAAARLLDPSETIDVRLEDFDKVLIRLRDGEMTMQAMHVAALWSAAAWILRGRELFPGGDSLRRNLRAVLL